MRRNCFDHEHGGNMILLDHGDDMIRRVSRQMLQGSGLLASVNVAGSGQCASQDGRGDHASFTVLKHIAVDLDGNYIVSDYCCIRRVTPDGDVTTIAGEGTEATFCDPTGLAIDGDNNIIVADMGIHGHT